MQGFGLAHGNHAVLPHLLQGLGNHLTQGLIPAGGRRNPHDILPLLNLIGSVLNCPQSRSRRALNALPEQHWTCARGHILHALPDHRLGQDHRGSGPVAYRLADILRDLLEHLHAQILRDVADGKILGYCRAVVGNHRRAGALGRHYIPPLGTQGDFYRVRKLVNSRLQFLSCFRAVVQISCHLDSPP